MKEIKVEQNTVEWMNLRAGKITASKFDVLMPTPKQKIDQFSKGQLTYLRQVSAEILTGEYEETYQNKAMQDGHEREPFAREALSKAVGIPIRESGFWEVNDMIGVSPDGIAGFNEFTVELKCPTSPTHLLYLLDIKELFKQYEWQIKSQMWGSGIHEGYYGSYSPLFEDYKQLSYSSYGLTEEDIDLLNNRTGHAVDLIKEWIV